jgi:hypothetical protein
MVEGRNIALEGGVTALEESRRFVFLVKNLERQIFLILLK